MDPPGPSDRPAGSTEGVPPRPGPGAPGQQPIPQAASLWTKLKSPSNFKLKVVLFSISALLSSISIHTIASAIASTIALRKWPWRCSCTLALECQIRLSGFSL
jgi:hypothetical protein